jgi:hypothetical protein
VSELYFGSLHVPARCVAADVPRMAREGGDMTSGVGSVPEDALRSLDQVRMVGAASVAVLVADGLTSRKAVERVGRSVFRASSSASTCFVSKKTFLRRYGAHEYFGRA